MRPMQKPTTTTTDTRTCANPACGRDFTPAREWQRFCSSDCRVAYHHQRLTTAPTHRIDAEPGDVILITVKPDRAA